MYLMSEKQFRKLVSNVSLRYAKNKGTDHDKALVQFLERRMDSVVLRAGLARTIMQARQMVAHGHFSLNGHKHNVPSYYVQPGDMIQVREKVAVSPLYQSAFDNADTKLAWLKVNKGDKTIEILDLPDVSEMQLPADVLKVIEFYARA